MMQQEKMTIVSQTEIAPDIFQLELQGQLVNEMRQPGQFLHLLVPKADLTLRRPISIAAIDSERQVVTLLYRTVGEGTKALAQLKEGSTLSVLGPRGHGFPVDEVNPGDTVYLIGGGIGIPPLYELAKQLTAREVSVVALLGYRSKKYLFYVDEFKKLGDVKIATEDGSYGFHGHVGQLMESLPMPNVVYSCGPFPMLKAVVSHYESMLDKVFISLEERMACGIGACYGCVCQSAEDETHLYKVCEDGPVFRGGQVCLED